MKHLLVIFLLGVAASTCHATSNVTFSGGGYEISVLLSDEDCKVVGLNVSGDGPNIISISTDELSAFSKAESDCKKKTIHLVVLRDESSSLFRIEKRRQERPTHSRGEEGDGVTRLADVNRCMPWILRFAIGSLFVFVIGAVLIAWACMSTGWETLSRLAWGSLTAGAGLIVSVVLSALSAVIHQGWRRFSLVAHECVGFALYGASNFCQVRVMKRRR